MARVAAQRWTCVTRTRVEANVREIYSLLENRNGMIAAAMVTQADRTQSHAFQVEHHLSPLLKYTRGPGWSPKTPTISFGAVAA
jgi:hypothetical protein